MVRRATLMRLVCEECARMEAVMQQQLPHVFQRLPLNTHGNLPLSEVCCPSLWAIAHAET